MDISGLSGVSVVHKDIYSRTSRNRHTILCNDIHELQTKEWLRKTAVYRSDCQRHKQSLELIKCQPITYASPTSYKSPSMVKWFLEKDIRDFWSRLPFLKASITSLYGTIPKIDSTKNIARKLQETSVYFVSCKVGTSKVVLIHQILFNIPMFWPEIARKCESLIH